MNRNNLLIFGCLISIIIVIIGAFVIIPTIGISADISNSTGNNSTNNIIASEDLPFDNSTPEVMAVSIAKLNFGVYFNEISVTDVYLTDDGKYWKVDLYAEGKDPYTQVTINAKTLMSKRNDDGEGWRSLDELKASYIADIQTNGPESIDSNGKPQKINMGGKEIWKVSTHYMDGDGQECVAYVYVDLATGKSKNTLPSFNKFAGTDGWLTLKHGWLTLKEVDNIINRGNKGDYPSNYLVDLGPGPFRDALRDSYPE